jgi:hypothetical protein
MSKLFLKPFTIMSASIAAEGEFQFLKQKWSLLSKSNFENR